ncbi:uncharacterized protein K489DRAFT_144718 [Dissoconium aciculare CBS 342.82]|uniref:Histone H1 n=1 Tax=Dissoconium aciculare CBS 342.82 TaxID=1314786 RepID=A0A6J3MBA3_9PEZI|nr:uncharacterized protein K489DRAFT_144718 [Dissoconium aciculare CBS 342.82]KAF1824914.1 hypothetical protein K489DRAFT_144718 [Dissoconium aciculare CBS 342.82]
MAGTKKATGTAAAPKKAASTAAHPSYQDMIKEAILQLKDRGGSSRQAIKKHLLANHPSVTNVSENAFTTQLNKALQRGTDSGVFLRPKGPRC